MKKYLTWLWFMIGFVLTGYTQTQEEARNLLVKMNETMTLAHEMTSEMNMSIYSDEGLISTSRVLVVKKEDLVYAKNGQQESLADGDIRIVADHNSKTLIYSEIIHLGNIKESGLTFDQALFASELDKNDYEYRNIKRENGFLSFEILMKGHGIFSSVFLAINESTHLLDKIIYFYRDASSVQRIEMKYTRNELKADEKLIPDTSQFVKGRGKQAVAHKDYASYRFINQANS